MAGGRAARAVRGVAAAVVHALRIVFLVVGRLLPRVFVGVLALLFAPDMLAKPGAPRAAPPALRNRPRDRARSVSFADEAAAVTPVESVSDIGEVGDPSAVPAPVQRTRVWAAATLPSLHPPFYPHRSIRRMVTPHPRGRSPRSSPPQGTPSPASIASPASLASPASPVSAGSPDDLADLDAFDAVPVEVVDLGPDSDEAVSGIKAASPDGVCVPPPGIATVMPASVASAAAVSSMGACAAVAGIAVRGASLPSASASLAANASVPESSDKSVYEAPSTVKLEPTHDDCNPSRSTEEVATEDSSATGLGSHLATKSEGLKMPQLEASVVTGPSTSAPLFTETVEGDDEDTAMPVRDLASKATVHTSPELSAAEAPSTVKLEPALGEPCPGTSSGKVATRNGSCTVLGDHLATESEVEKESEREASPLSRQATPASRVTETVEEYEEKAAMRIRGDTLVPSHAASTSSDAGCDATDASLSAVLYSAREESTSDANQLSVAAPTEEEVAARVAAEAEERARAAIEAAEAKAVAILAAEAEADISRAASAPSDVAGYPRQQDEDVVAAREEAFGKSPPPDTAADVWKADFDASITAEAEAKAVAALEAAEARAAAILAAEAKVGTVDALNMTAEGQAYSDEAMRDPTCKESVAVLVPDAAEVLSGRRYEALMDASIAERASVPERLMNDVVAEVDFEEGPETDAAEVAAECLPAAQAVEEPAPAGVEAVASSSAASDTIIIPAAAEAFDARREGDSAEEAAAAVTEGTTKGAALAHAVSVVGESLMSSAHAGSGVGGVGTYRSETTDSELIVGKLTVTESDIADEELSKKLALRGGEDTTGGEPLAGDERWRASGGAGVDEEVLEVASFSAERPVDGTAGIPSSRPPLIPATSEAGEDGEAGDARSDVLPSVDDVTLASSAETSQDVVDRNSDANLRASGDGRLTGEVDIMVDAAGSDGGNTTKEDDVNRVAEASCFVAGEAETMTKNAASDMAGKCRAIELGSGATMSSFVAHDAVDSAYGAVAEVMDSDESRVATEDLNMSLCTSRKGNASIGAAYDREATSEYAGVDDGVFQSRVSILDGDPVVKHSEGAKEEPASLSDAGRELDEVAGGADRDRTENAASEKEVDPAESLTDAEVSTVNGMLDEGVAHGTVDAVYAGASQNATRVVGLKPETRGLPDDVCLDREIPTKGAAQEDNMLTSIQNVGNTGDRSTGGTLIGMEPDGYPFEAYVEGRRADTASPELGVPDVGVADSDFVSPTKSDSPEAEDASADSAPSKQLSSAVSVRREDEAPFYRAIPGEGSPAGSASSSTFGAIKDEVEKTACEEPTSIQSQALAKVASISVASVSSTDSPSDRILSAATSEETADGLASEIAPSVTSGVESKPSGKPVAAVLDAEEERPLESAKTDGTGDSSAGATAPSSDRSPGLPSPSNAVSDSDGHYEIPSKASRDLRLDRRVADSVPLEDEDAHTGESDGASQASSSTTGEVSSWGATSWPPPRRAASVLVKRIAGSPDERGLPSQILPDPVTTNLCGEAINPESDPAVTSKEVIIDELGAEKSSLAVDPESMVSLKASSPCGADDDVGRTTDEDSGTQFTQDPAFLGFQDLNTDALENEGGESTVAQGRESKILDSNAEYASRLESPPERPPESADAVAGCDVDSFYSRDLMMSVSALRPEESLSEPKADSESPDEGQEPPRGSGHDPQKVLGFSEKAKQTDLDQRDYVDSDHPTTAGEKAGEVVSATWGVPESSAAVSARKEQALLDPLVAGSGPSVDGPSVDGPVSADTVSPPLQDVSSKVRESAADASAGADMRPWPLAKSHPLLAGKVDHEEDDADESRADGGEGAGGLSAAAVAALAAAARQRHSVGSTETASAAKDIPASHASPAISSDLADTWEQASAFAQPALRGVRYHHRASHAPPLPPSDTGALKTTARSSSPIPLQRNAVNTPPPPPPPPPQTQDRNTDPGLYVGVPPGDEFDVDVDVELTEDMSEYETDRDAESTVVSHLQEELRDQEEREQQLLQEKRRQYQADKEQRMRQRMAEQDAFVAHDPDEMPQAVSVDGSSASEQRRVGVVKSRVARRMDSRGNFVKVKSHSREIDATEEDLDDLVDHEIEDDGIVDVESFALSDVQLASREGDVDFPEDSPLRNPEAVEESQRAKAIRDERVRRRATGQQSFLGYDIDEESSQSLASGVPSSPMPDSVQEPQVERRRGHVATSGASGSDNGRSLSSGSKDGSSRQPSGGMGVAVDYPQVWDASMGGASAHVGSSAVPASQGGAAPRSPEKQAPAGRRLVFQRPAGPSREVAEVKDSIKKIVKRYRPGGHGSPPFRPTLSSTGGRGPAGRLFQGGSNASGVRGAPSMSKSHSYASHGKNAAASSASPMLVEYTSSRGPNAGSQPTYSGIAGYSGVPRVDASPALQHAVSYGGSTSLSGAGSDALYNSAPVDVNSTSAEMSQKHPQEEPDPLPAVAGPEPSSVSRPTAALEESGPTGGTASMAGASLTQFVSDLTIGRTVALIGRLLTQIGCTVAVKRNNHKMKVIAPYGTGSDTLHASISVERDESAPEGGLDRTVVTVMRSKEDRGRTPVEEFVSFYHVLRQQFSEAAAKG